MKQAFPGWVKSPGKRGGFSLMEIMAAVAILMVIVMLMGRIFTDGWKIWSLSTKRAYSMAEGRAVMDVMTRELSQAFADSNIVFKLVSDRDLVHGGEKTFGVDVYDWQTDELYFISAVRTPEYSGMRRAAPHYVYFVTNMWDYKEQPMPNRYTLVRCRRTASTHNTADRVLKSAYHNLTWWETFNPVIRYVSGNDVEMEPLAENIAAFEVWAYTNDVQDAYNFNSTEKDYNKLPLWVDLYLETFSEQDAIQMAILWDADKNAAKEFRDRNVRRYSSRVYFPNRMGRAKDINP